MSPIAKYVWELVSEPNVPVDLQHRMAWHLWREADTDAAWYASRATALCMVVALKVRAGAGAVLRSVDRPPALGELLGGDERAQEIGEATWHHAASLVTSIDMGVVDSTHANEFEELVNAYQGDAVFFFLTWGRSTIADVAKRLNDATFEQRLAWIEQQLTFLDDEYVGEG